MREVSHWDRSAGDEHVGKVILIVLLAAILFGGWFFWRISTANVQAPSIDLLGTRSESARVVRPGSGYQPQQAQAQEQQATAQQATQAQAQAQEAQPTAVPTAAPTVQPTPQAGLAHVAHTDGVGVVLRNSPKDVDKMPRGLMDGAEVTVLERQGTDWARVRGPGGQEGWIPTRYLDQ